MYLCVAVVGVAAFCVEFTQALRDTAPPARAALFKKLRLVPVLVCDIRTPPLKLDYWLFECITYFQIATMHLCPKYGMVLAGSIKDKKLSNEHLKSSRAMIERVVKIDLGKLEE